MKKFIFSAAILGLVAPIALATTSVSADTSSTATATEMQTNATVTFTGVASLPTNPVNPTNPSDTKNNDTPGNNPEDNSDQPTNTIEPDNKNGGLELYTAPAFNFGSVDLSNFSGGDSFTTNAVTNALNKSGFYYAQVGDNRSTGPTGWKLNATMSQFTNESATKTLPSSTLNLGTPTITNTNDGSDPTANQVTTNGKNYTVPKNSLISGKQAETLANVASGSGYGVTSINWAIGNVNLNLPNGVQNVALNGETYKSTITWTVQQAQSN